MIKRKASLGLGAVLEEKKEEIQNYSTTTLAPSKLKSSKLKENKKQSIPIYVNPLLHEALHVLVFSERHKKTTFQTIFIEALDMFLKQRGLPSVDELSNGKKTINL